MEKYKQIYQDILTAIENHQHKRGEKLPSIRQLSQAYSCSKETVQKALTELKYQRKIYAVEKSGYYILEDQQFIEETVALNPEDFQKLPYHDFQTCLKESLVGRENYLFNYYHQHEGLEELLHSLHTLLAHYDVYSKKEQLVVTAGSQQALYIMSQITVDTEKTDILIESPTYSRMQDILEKLHLPYQTIERTLQGIDLTVLEKLFQTGRFKFFYTIPRLHNPLGTTYDLATRKEIVRLAQQYGVYIVEDDYLADFDSKKTLPLHYLDTEEHVVYIKSFTPTLFPALRIGCVVLPEKLRSPFLTLKSLMDYDTNLIMQKALSLYIDNGMFQRNTNLLQQEYRRQQEQLQQLLQASNIPLPFVCTDTLVTFQLPKDLFSTTIKHRPFAEQRIETENLVFLQLKQGHQLKKTLIDFAACLLP